MLAEIDFIQQPYFVVVDFMRLIILCFVKPALGTTSVRYQTNVINSLKEVIFDEEINAVGRRQIIWKIVKMEIHLRSPVCTTELPTK